MVRRRRKASREKSALDGLPDASVLGHDERVRELVRARDREQVDRVQRGQDLDASALEAHFAKYSDDQLAREELEEAVEHRRD